MGTLARLASSGKPLRISDQPLSIVEQVADKYGFAGCACPHCACLRCIL